MSIKFKQLIETGVLPDSAKKARDPKYDVKDRIKKLAGLDDSDITSFDIEDVESKSFDNVVKNRTNTEINRGETKGNPEMPKAVQESYKAGQVKLKDGTLFELDEIGAHCLNKMLNNSKRPDSLDKVARKNSKEFTSILQFAKSLGESAELSEVNSRAFQRITGVSLRPTTSNYHKFEDDRGGSSSNYKDPAQVKRDKDKLSEKEKENKK